MPATDLDLKAIHAQLEKTITRLAPKTGKSRYPYYTEQAAGEVIEAVHAALSQCKPVIWTANSVSVNTLYNRFRQGAQYVTDKLDKDFGDKMRVIQLTRIPKLGLRIAPREGIGMLVDPDLSWKPDLERYLDESTPGCQPFERINLPLSKSDIDWIENTMYPLKHLFLYEVTSHRLLIIRINESKGNLKSADGGTREAVDGSIDPTTWAADSGEPRAG